MLVVQQLPTFKTQCSQANNNAQVTTNKVNLRTEANKGPQDFTSYLDSIKFFDNSEIKKFMDNFAIIINALSYIRYDKDTNRPDFQLSSEVTNDMKSEFIISLMTILQGKQDINEVSSENALILLINITKFYNNEILKETKDHLLPLVDYTQNKKDKKLNITVADQTNDHKAQQAINKAELLLNQPIFDLPQGLKTEDFYEEKNGKIPALTDMKSLKQQQRNKSIKEYGKISMAIIGVVLLSYEAYSYFSNK